MMASNDGEHDNFCKNKLLLKPEEASILDLICVLFSSNLENRKFIEKHPQDQKWREFNRRWLIFISVLVQKALILIGKPMASIGNSIEMSLNLVSNNGGLFKLVLNLIPGNVVVWPDRSSASFTSMVGNLDTRLELDKNIRQGEPKYKVSLSLMASKLSYENQFFIKNIVEDHWKMEFLGFYNFWNDYMGRPTTQAFMLQDTRSDPNLIVVAFRGTNPFDADAWCTDVDISWHELEGVGKIHSGFMKALGLQKNQGWPIKVEQNTDHQFAYYTIKQMLKTLLQKNEKAKFVLTGHSLGGALAILFAAVLVIHEEAWLLERLESVYTFGQPRVGNKQFGDFMKEKFRKYSVRYLRFVYSNDMVPRLPYDDTTLLYKHFGTCLFYNSCYKGKVMGEEPNKNYFSPLWVAPKILNAVWELIRSFIIPCKEGPDYREGWLMKMFRVVGVAIPGLTAHSLRDYDNSTRLASLPLFFQLQDPICEEQLHKD
ncbi:putative triacylglycerol lipase [Tripterygium wilfordii]|uniref:Putative triacylglycerol lipase n=1 Tax=Tripterygium wilfordii TaxID=458696 RepID=A0A7J7D2X5_TRIWF|nr:triacylglycerol lipase OBL1-like [Tripterygium wilfordii]KAF5740673.1 putative triacylglycerol lipase [Tripterygium wilfordii]